MRPMPLEQPPHMFLMHRVARDMGTLCAWLDQLDSAALAAQRRITIPLIRELLANRE